MAKMTKAEAGRKGGIIRWAKLPKKKRAAHMAKVAKARWDKNVDKVELSRQLVQGV